MTRGQLARQTGCNAETIRYYEHIGLMPEPRRGANGYRRYDQQQARRLRFIMRGRASVAAAASAGVGGTAEPGSGVPWSILARRETASRVFKSVLFAHGVAARVPGFTRRGAALEVSCFPTTPPTPLLTCFAAPAPRSPIPAVAPPPRAPPGRFNVGCRRPTIEVT